MKIAVCVKHAVNETELKMDSNRRPILSGAVSRMSIFDKNAVEEGLRQRSVHQGEVVIFTVGSPDAKKTMKEALAMGADKGVLVTVDPIAVDTVRTAALLATAIRKSGPFDLVLCSEGSSDTYSGQVPPMLGEMLVAAFVGYVKKLEINGKTARIERSLEDSVEVVEAPVPVVVSVVSEINEPRYLTLIQVMQGGKKPVEELNGEQLLPAEGYEPAFVVSMYAQQSSRKHVIIEGSPEEAANRLVDALIKEGVLSR